MVEEYFYFKKYRKEKGFVKKELKMSFNDFIFLV